MSDGRELARLIGSGQLHYDEDIQTHIDQAPQALVDVDAGRNRGKKRIRLRQDHVGCHRFPCPDTGIHCAF